MYSAAQLKLDYIFMTGLNDMPKLNNHMHIKRQTSVEVLIHSGLSYPKSIKLTVFGYTPHVTIPHPCSPCVRLETCGLHPGNVSIVSANDVNNGRWNQQPLLKLPGVWQRWS